MIASVRLTHYLMRGPGLLRAIASGSPHSSTICSGYPKQVPGTVTWTATMRFKSTDHKSHQTSCPKMTDRSSESRILTVPNLLTSTRILLTPAIGYFIWHEMHLCALSCFSLAALTDLFDGLIARRLNQCSKLGAILDPIADKLLLTTCFLALYHVNLMPVWLVGSFILRDVALLGGGTVIRYCSFSEKPDLKQFLDFNKYPAPDFEPTFISKCNTALQCGLIVTHLATNQLAGAPYYDLTITGLHALTTSTTVISFGQYLSRVGRASFRMNSRKEV